MAITGKDSLFSHLRPVEKSQTLLLNEQSRNLENSGREVFKFGFGQSPFPPLRRATKALSRHARQKAYLPVQGLPELRERVAVFHREAERIVADASCVIIAPGSKALLYAAMATFQQADILIPSPSWVSYRPQAALLGHHAIAVQTMAQGRWRVTPEALELALRQKADPTIPTVLILNYPGNPDGLSYSEDELQALADVLRKHHVLAISDEIYGLLDHQGKHRPLSLYYPEGTITTGGLSKWCGAGGWRLGIAMLPEPLDGAYKDTLLGIASETWSCASTPVQYAACEAYVWDDTTRSYLAHQRRILALAGNWIAQRLQEAGIAVHAPQGGFYLFLDFSALSDAFANQGIIDSRTLCAKLLEDTGVALLPGEAFGIDDGRLCARLAYIEFDGAQALAASERIGLDRPLDKSFLHQYMEKNVRGTERLCEWISFTAGSVTQQKIAMVG